MLSSLRISLLLFSATRLLAQGDPFQQYTISAPGINATFVPYGATLTSLYVVDKDGNPQDVVLGYDQGKQYQQDSQTNHTYFGAVVGRYANRIKNGTFTIDGQTSHIPQNEHDGFNTLHGGLVGYDQRNWTVVSHNDTTITFSLVDAAFEGFPGTVITYTTYTVAERQWKSRMVSIPLDAPTPIMLSNHVYWNLGAFVNPQARTILNHTLHMPYGDRIVVVDNISVPTGELLAVDGTPYDFRTPKQVGRDLENAHGAGFNSTGYDNAWIMDRPRYSGPESTDLTLLTLSSPDTGIQLDLRTNQQSLQIYTCDRQNGTIPVKQSQNHGPGQTYVEQNSCFLIETQQWIDGVNHPEWGQRKYQIYYPDSPAAVHWAQYDFSIVGECTKNVATAKQKSI